MAPTLPEPGKPGASGASGASGMLSSPTLSKPPEQVNVYELGPKDLADYFIKRISREWASTLVEQDLKAVPTNMGLLSDPDQLSIYNPHNDCLYKIRVDRVPEQVVKKLEDLAHAQDFGVGCFKQLGEVLKKMLQDVPMPGDPERDYGEGVKGAVAMVRAQVLSDPCFPSQQYLMTVVLHSWQNSPSRPVRLWIFPTK